MLGKSAGVTLFSLFATIIFLPFALLLIGVELGAFVLNSVGYVAGHIVYVLAYVGGFFGASIINIGIGVSEYGVNLVLDEFLGFLASSVETVFNSFIGSETDPSPGTINYFIVNFNTIIEYLIGTIESSINTIIGAPKDDPPAGTINYIVNTIEGSVNTIINNAQSSINAIIGTKNWIGNYPDDSINGIIQSIEDGVNEIRINVQGSVNTVIGTPKEDPNTGSVNYIIDTIENTINLTIIAPIQDVLDILQWIKDNVDYTGSFPDIPNINNISIPKIEPISLDPFTLGHIDPIELSTLQLGNIDPISLLGEKGEDFFTIPTISQLDLGWDWTWDAPWEWRKTTDYVGEWTWTWVFNWRWGDSLEAYAQKLRD